MLQNSIKAEDWLEIVGKDRLQAYQDSYAKLNSISLVFVDPEGKPLTVWSNAPLLCSAVAEKYSERCVKERKNQLQQVTKHRELIISSCFVGIKNFIFPVYYNKVIVAYCIGGGVAGDTMKISNKSLANYHMQVIEDSNFLNIARTLQYSLQLLNLDVELVLKKSYGESSNSEQDIFRGRLSKREAEVAKAICAGMTNKQIADSLFISEKTVKTHVSNILLKLDLNDRVQLVVDYCRFIAGSEVKSGEYTEKN